MARRRLTLDHPHVWLASLPSKTWDDEAKKYFFAPTLPKPIAAAYINSYLRSTLASYALRLLNMDHSLDDDTEASLLRDLEAHAIAAGRRVGVTFSEGRSTAAQTIAGNLSLDDLRRTVRRVVPFAVAVWDPAVAKRLHKAAVEGGRNSHRGRGKKNKYRVEDLPPGSIAAQMEALDCSRSTIRRLRRELAQAKPVTDETTTEGDALLRSTIVATSSSTFSARGSAIRPADLTSTDRRHAGPHSSGEKV